MKVLGYTRVSSDKQDLQKQEHLLLKYAQQQDLRINDFIRVEISSRKDTKERRIDELLDWLDDGDVLLVAELSRLGRNMFEVIDIINQLGENGVEVIFVRQPGHIESFCWLFTATSLRQSANSSQYAPNRDWPLPGPRAKN
jgi:DNA invertase Pin-like site-specific DNA recombinase